MHSAKRAASAFLSCLLLLSPAPPAAAARADDKAKKPAADAASGELHEGRRLLRRREAGGALVRLQNALRLFEQAGRRKGVAAAHEQLGELYERQALYEQALTHFLNSLKALNAEFATTKKKNDSFNINLLLARIGHTSLRLGDTAGARAAYSKMYAGKIEKSELEGLEKGGILGGAVSGILGGGSKNREVGVGISVGSGLAFAKTRYDYYRRAIIYADRELGLGRLDFRAGNYAEARKHFENVQEAADGGLPFLGKLGRTRRYRAVAYTSLGDTSLAESKPEQAVKEYERAAKEAEGAGRLDLAWPAQRGAGRANRLLREAAPKEKEKEKFLAAALKYYRAAVASVEEMRQGSVRADEARAAFLLTTRVVYDEASALLAEQALAVAPPGRPLAGAALVHAEEAFRFTELGRARSLLELLDESATRVEPEEAPDDFRLLRENLDGQEEVAQLLTGLRLSPADDDDEKEEDIKKLEERADKLLAAYVEIENRIRTRSPRYRELTKAQPPALEEVRRDVLGPDTALLEYSLGVERSYLFAATADGATLQRLPGREEIDKQVTELRAQILPRSLRRSIIALTDDEAHRGLTVAPARVINNAADFARAAHKLYQTVVGPASAFVGARRLLVVGEGSLSYVPFEALVTAEGGADFSELPYLVERNEVIYAPSAAVAGALRKRAPGGAAATSVLVVADPVFEAADPRAPKGETAATPASLNAGLLSAARDVTATRLDGGAARFARLPGTRDEADKIERLAASAGLRADKWLSLDASETNVSTGDLGKYRIIHFATHGLLDAERPQFTGLVLSLVGNRDADGYLRTGEVFNLRLKSAPLVMLSACETGLGKERRGEGVIGLTRAFIYAGAPTVGVSLWSVSDRSTEELMAEFYFLLLDPTHPSPSAALREARRRRIKHPRYNAPFYWAPFVLVGDWR